jgi:hypothetical protein
MVPGDKRWTWSKRKAPRIELLALFNSWTSTGNMRYERSQTDHPAAVLTNLNGFVCMFIFPALTQRTKPFLPCFVCRLNLILNSCVGLVSTSVYLASAFLSCDLALILYGLVCATGRQRRYSPDKKHPARRCSFHCYACTLLILCIQRRNVMLYCNPVMSKRTASHANLPPSLRCKVKGRQWEDSELPRAVNNLDMKHLHTVYINRSDQVTLFRY